MVSLLRILRFEPFSSTACFQKHILEPLSRDTPERCNNLQRVLRGICLRRNEKYLGLPEPRYEEIRLSLTPNEQLHYDRILKECRYEIDDLVSTKTKVKKYTILFTMIMKLRRLCNHGTLSIPIQPTLSPTPSLEADVDSHCDYCSGVGEENMARLNGDEICPECNQCLSGAPLKTSSTSRAQNSEAASGRSISENWSLDSICPTNSTSVRELPGECCTKLVTLVQNISYSSKR